MVTANSDPELSAALRSKNLGRFSSIEAIVASHSGCKNPETRQGSKKREGRRDLCWPFQGWGEGWRWWVGERAVFSVGGRGGVVGVVVAW